MNEQDKNQKKIFEEEQAHLTQTHGKLRAMKEELEERINTISEKAAKEKQDIRSNLSLNFDSDTDSMETYIEFEAMSHSITQYNIEQDAAAEKLGRVKRLLKAPYFARVKLQFDPSEEPEDYYIGSAGVSENAFEHLVIDWRSPIAETYYNQENGKTFYTVNGNKVDVDLQLRRQYNLEEDRLFSFFDTQVAIEDPMLLQSLASSRTDKMKAITATIQKEQNAVIRCADVPVLLVNGIAGSGKTSVLLQRIAYLFYRQRENLRPDQVYLLTINPVFRQYIDQVLPDLGEENPRTITWRDFVHIANAPDKGPYEPAKEADLVKIERALKSLRLEEEDFRPVMQKGRCVLSRKEIRKAAEGLSGIETGVRFMNILADRLAEIARVKIRRMERDDRRNYDVEMTAGADPEAGDAGFTAGGAGSESVGSGQAASAASFNSMDPYAETDEPGFREQNRIRNQYGGAFSAISHFAFLDIERIGCRILGRKKMTSAEWIWLKMLLTGIGDKNVRYVMIDEVQDYTAAQLMVLRRYFGNAKFMMLGDEFQAIRQGTASFDKIRELFGDVEEFPLLTSYRSSPEITEIFTRLLPREKRIRTASVQRPGTAPVKMACASRDEYVIRLRSLISAAKQDKGLTAVICGSRRSLERIAELLGEDAPPVIRRNQVLPSGGVFLITPELVKGLEFDGVILPDADPQMYQGDNLSRHRLYTAVSRAIRRLSILAEGNLTGLLEKSAE
ncbi:MAG: ATP-binding domain-containing protein [Lachnospiraceae bacterium]|nr:ATP-binding domain-containing protein [Lachnospiraceae bacterium]